ncbi:hypothetical protein, partial [Streptomyces jeddahensis]|uniref:hypothetical protein n=1 Tax=Streptomyces jeddahensis TaxID=1716141 RepID=UPI000AFE1D94
MCARSGWRYVWAHLLDEDGYLFLRDRNQFAGSSLHIGHQLVLMDKWTPEEMLRLIATRTSPRRRRTDRYRCTHTHMVPTQFHRL